jgi:NAD(P)-dependent dehydrogenase (short-subunit alcohol dehydrogenase family)
MATALAHAGASVVLWARQRDRLLRLQRILQAEGHRALVQCVDITRPQAVQAAVGRIRQRWHRIDILVNNAGVWGGDPFVTLSLPTWSRVLTTDLTGAFIVSQSVIPSMRRHHYGKIINIASTSGIIAHSHGSAYGSAKAGLIHLTRIMALELGPNGIRVNGIAPGLFRTDLTADVFADRRWVAQRLRRVPLGRFGEPNDLAGLVVFLASSASDHITGQTIVIDGGASLAVE